ncbi:PEP-CTERM sorting domain-containing protein [Azohydromonas aeria]|uniref:PEP-CTERM sorting domain-containing protein n=1 Tax=Azohydromonas aeria TaxID=2590212 RepID=UPI0012FA30DF|nr:PEP-CTERM sorting domain-containing protein [Azohydromonas aeria]
MKTGFPLPLLAALVMAAAWPSAHADISARARLDNFGYRLVDLRPRDGMAPALRFVRGGDSSASVGLTEGSREEFESRSNGLSNFAPMVLRSDLPGLHAEARMGGVFGAGPGRFSAVASGFLRSRAAEDVERGFGALLQPSFESYGDGLFEVTPFTRVVFSGVVTTDVRRTVADSASFVQTAQASVHLTYSTQPGWSERREYGVELAGGAERHRRLRQSVSFTFENAGSSVGNGVLGIQVLATGQVSPGLMPGALAPVPEPATLALLLCGLGVVAGAAARGRRRGA